MERVDSASLEQFGEFEVMDPKAIADGSGLTATSLLSKARDSEYGRPGVPQASLLRVVDAGPGLIPLERDRLVWMFRWSELAEEYPKAFPVEDGKPQSTVFLLNDYYLLVDAVSGEVIASVQH